MSYQIAMQVQVRRAADTEALAREIEESFRAETVGDRDLDYSGVFPKKRGGEIAFRAFVDDAGRETILDRLRRIGDSIESNRNRIDRVDTYRIAAFAGDRIVAFVGGDFKGWQREVALEELDAEPPPRLESRLPYQPEEER